MPAPPSTNWLRIDSGGKSHTVTFASHDWKMLNQLPMGRHWLMSFGFLGPTKATIATIAKGPLIGYEVVGDREIMLSDSRALLPEVVAYAHDPTPPSYFHGSMRPRKLPRKRPITWPTVLPPVIDFLASLDATKVTIYNHHR